MYSHLMWSVPGTFPYRNLPTMHYSIACIAIASLGYAYIILLYELYMFSLTLTCKLMFWQLQFFKHKFNPSILTIFFIVEQFTDYNDDFFTSLFLMFIQVSTSSCIWFSEWIYARNILVYNNPATSIYDNNIIIWLRMHNNYWVLIIDTSKYAWVNKAFSKS